MNNITIFTDGSSRGNPGSGGWGAVIVDKIENKIVEFGGREDNTTNNRMELTASIEGLLYISSYIKANSDHNMIINTDSSYVINGITKWINGWKRNGWITKTEEEVMNKDLWQKLLRATEGKDIQWNYVGGHAGIVGNERCDEIATQYADKVSEKEINLYKGSFENYSIKNILDLTQVVEKVSKKSHSKAQAYSYISKVDGKIEIHKTWAECEARVKGKSNTRYRKAISKENESQIIEGFEKF